MSAWVGPCTVRASRLRRALAALSLASLALTGCQAREQGSRHALTLGEHHLSVRVPAGWQLLEFGREARMSRGEVVLTVGDLGPAGPEGILREVERARALWRSGQDRDARWVLRRVPVPDELFGTQVQRTAFWADWSQVSQAPEGADRYTIDEAFERIRENVAALVQPDLRALAGTFVAQMEPAARREIAASHPRLVAGRPAVVIRTWDRLTHNHPRRVAIVLEAGYALKIDTEAGTLGLAGPAFEGLLDSLRFEASPSGSTGVVSEGAIRN